MNLIINTVLAQEDIGENFNSPWGKIKDLGDFFGIILSLGLSLAGVIVLFTFIFAGLNIIKGAGDGDPKAAAQGKQALTYAVAGFLVVFTAFWIVRAIELLTGATLITGI